MTRIFIKEKSNRNIKTFNKTQSLNEKIKNISITTKNQIENSSDDNNDINEYDEEKINNLFNYSSNKTRKEIGYAKDKLINKFKQRNIHVKRKTRKFKDKNSKVNKRSKKIEHQSKLAITRARELAIKGSKITIKNIKMFIKIIISSVKYSIAALKSLIGLIASGGIIAVIVTIIICLVALMCSSIFGIFLSSEKTSKDDIRMNSVVSECNNELANKIKEIQLNNPHDDYVIDSNRAEWKDILAIYTVKLSNGFNQKEVMSINDNKKKILKQIFWDMNQLSYEVKDEVVLEDMTDKKGKPKQVQKKVLHIYINSKSLNQMKLQYNFNASQIKQLNELTNKRYSMLWSSAIYGISSSSNDIVEIAKTQLGNVGGQPYWSWYGFNTRVAWCACFVSWVAEQAGYINNNVIPKFSGCENGVDWFKAMGQWKEAGYIPKPGTIIFFDWERDGGVNHVGIVEKVENGRVYTIEGNSGDECKQQNYDINSKVIYGYGTPAY